MDQEEIYTKEITKKNTHHLSNVHKFFSPMLFLSFLNPDPEDGDPMEIGGRPSAPHAMEEKKGASKTRSVPPPTQDRTRNAVT